MQRILLTEPIHPDAAAYLRQNFDVAQGVSTEEKEIIAQGRGCAGILVRTAKITQAVIDGIPSLRVVAKHGIGVDNIDVAYATEKGVLVVNAPLSNINAVAEHTVALVLAAAKNIVFLDAKTRQGDFKSSRSAYPTVELKGKTVGLLGLGRIARLVAKKLSGFELRLIGCDPFVKPAEVSRLGIELVTQENLFENADFICVHTPLTQQTKHLVGGELLKKMKPSAFLINTSRGPVVDEQALAEALRSKILAGAGLDVFENEPPQAEDALFGMDNVVVSPHNAALSDGALLAMAMDSAKGITEFLTGQAVSWPVNRL